MAHTTLDLPVEGGMLVARSKSFWVVSYDRSSPESVSSQSLFSLQRPSCMEGSRVRETACTGHSCYYLEKITMEIMRGDIRPLNQELSNCVIANTLMATLPPVN
jgi:hypothetical protein